MIITNKSNKTIPLKSENSTLLFRCYLFYFQFLICIWLINVENKTKQFASDEKLCITRKNILSSLLSKSNNMDLYIFFLGILFFFGGVLFLIMEIAHTKKSLDMYRIRIYGGLFGFIILGLWLIYSELSKL